MQQRFTKYTSRGLLLTLISALAFACFPDPLHVDNVPVHQTELAVSSQLFLDSVFNVYVSRTISALEAGPDSNIEEVLNESLVQGGTVIVSNQGQSYTLTEVSPGIYGSITIPKNYEEKYRLEVYDPQENLTASSVTTLKTPVKFEKVRLSIVEKHDTVVYVHYTINDPAGTNFYMINVQRISANLADYNFLRPSLHTELLKDTSRIGGSLEGSFAVIKEGFKREDSLYVSLANIDSAYFEYIRLLNNQKNWLFNETKEPINFPTNIEKGKGFFTMHSAHTLFFKLGDI